MPDTRVTPTPATPHDLLIAVRNVIIDNPERHNQMAWLSSIFPGVIDATVGTLRKYARMPIPDVPADSGNPVCGTTACVAGWAVILGSNPDIEISSWGMDITIEEDAINLLGLNSGQADVLFDGRRTRHEVLTMLDALIADPGAELRLLTGEDEDEDEDEDE